MNYQDREWSVEEINQRQKELDKRLEGNPFDGSARAEYKYLNDRKWTLLNLWADDKSI